jgi:hypothetical protein
MSAAGELEPLDVDTLQQISTATRSISACMSRVLEMGMPVKVPDGRAVPMPDVARASHAPVPGPPDDQADPDPRPRRAGK